MLFFPASQFGYPGQSLSARVRPARHGAAACSASKSSPDGSRERSRHCRLRHAASLNVHRSTRSMPSTPRSRCERRRRRAGRRAARAARRGRARAALARLAGLALDRRGRASRSCASAFAEPARDGARVACTSSIEIERPVADVFAFFKDFENFPRVIGVVRSVVDYQDGRSHWEVYTPSGGVVDVGRRRHEVRAEQRHRVGERVAQSRRERGRSFDSRRSSPIAHARRRRRSRIAR